MQPRPTSEKVAERFPGRVSNYDPGDIPFGAAVVQDNIQSLIPGKMTVRKGWQRATDYCRSDIGSVSRADLTGIYRYRHANGDQVVTVSDDGKIQSRKIGSVSDIKTGIYGDTSWSFARDRCGALLGVNGYGRGIYWDGITSTAGIIGLDPPTTKPTITMYADTGGAVEAEGDYIFYYRYVAGPAGNLHYSNLSPPETITTVDPTDIGKSFRWNNLLDSAQDRVHTIELWRSLPGDNNTLYFIGSIATDPGSLSFSSSGGGKLLVTATRLLSYEPGQLLTITGSTADNGTFVVLSCSGYQVELDVVWSGSPAGAAVMTPEGVDTDTYGDQQLQLIALSDPSKITYLSSNGELIATRFVPPPEWKLSIAKFQDRMFYAADAITTDGSVSTTAGNPTVSITGTDSTSHLVAGSVLYITGEPEPLEILSAGATTVTVNPAPSNNASGVSHAVRPAECERNAIYYSEPDEPQSVPRTNVITVQEQAEDEDEIVGIHSFGQFLYVLKEHHIYTISFIRQPRIDAQARLLLHRGAFNKNCWDTYEGVAYLMDASGCYAMGMGGAFTPVSDPIQDLWRDGVIDITDTKWFFVKVDSHYSIVRFYVRFVGDYGTKPRRALCYNIRTGAWWTESYPLELSGAISLDVNSKRITLGSSQNDFVVNLADGEADLIATELRGTVSSATATTVEDTSATFTDQHIGCPIAIIDSAGSAQARTIVDLVSSTEVQISSGSPVVDFDQADFSPVPIEGSTYVIGGIAYLYRTGQVDLNDEEQQNKRSLQLEYSLTNKEYDIWLRRYWNEDEDPEINWLTQDLGTGVTTIPGQAEAWIATKKEIKPRGIRSGRSEFVISGRKDHRTNGYWSVSFEIEGVKGDEQIEIRNARFLGAS